MNQCWNIVNWGGGGGGDPGKKFNEFLIKSIHFDSRDALENVVWKMAAILSRPQCVKRGHLQPVSNYLILQEIRIIFMLPEVSEHMREVTTSCIIYQHFAGHDLRLTKITSSMVNRNTYRYASDVITRTLWCHDMETLSTSLAFVKGIHRWPMDSSHKGPVMWSFDVFVAVEQSVNKQLICRCF